MCWCCKYFRLCFCLSPICCTAIVASVSVLIGMLIMFTFMNSYYLMFFPSIPMASLEHTGMYDYINDYSVVKRENDQESKDHREDYIDEDSDNTEDVNVDVGIPRDKRNMSASTSESSSTMDTGRRPATFWKTKSKSNTKTGTTNFTASENTYNVIDDETDFHLSNIIMDSVFSLADRENMTQSLGLCRKGVDLKIPSFKVSYFPAEEAVDILNCINDIMKNITKTQICIQLDGELNAYLKWLILTGEPKEAYKPPMPVVTDNFLFPSTPCSNNTNYDVVNLQEPPKCLAEKGPKEKI